MYMFQLNEIDTGYTVYSVPLKTVVHERYRTASLHRMANRLVLTLLPNGMAHGACFMEGELKMGSTYSDLRKQQDTDVIFSFSNGCDLPLTLCALCMDEPAIETPALVNFTLISIIVFYSWLCC